MLIEGLHRRYTQPFKDHRGSYTEIWNKDVYGMKEWAEQDISVSKKDVLRGIHVDNKANKMVTCLYGMVFVAIVDPLTHIYQAFTIKDAEEVLYVSAGLGIGHLVLSDEAIWFYNQSERYDPKRQTTIKWNDPLYDIPWPIKNPILSERDS